MLEEVIKTLQKIPEEKIQEFAKILYLSCHKRIWIAGNGGSASTASHFASDLASLGFDVICLTDNVPRLTAITNDYGWELAYIKQMSHVTSGDILIAISVHGGAKGWSDNLTHAATLAKEKNVKVLSLVGHDGGQLAKLSNLSIIVPSNSTPIIEGIHCVLTHIIRQKIEELSKCSK